MFHCFAICCIFSQLARFLSCFTLFHLVCTFPWLICLPRALACVWVLLVLPFGEIWSQSHAFPVVDRPCLALVRQCRKKKKKQGFWAGVVRTASDGQEKTSVIQWEQNCKAVKEKVQKSPFIPQSANSRKTQNQGNTGPWIVLKYPPPEKSDPTLQLKRLSSQIKTSSLTCVHKTQRG